MASDKIGRRGPRVIPVELRNGTVTVYGSARVADALQELMADMTLYSGVKFAQVVEAVYEQGRRDGRREVFDEFDRVKEKPELKHRNPGRPLKRATPKVDARRTTTREK
jgi:hypothetical protein